MSKSLVICNNPECQKEFLRDNKEINRSKKMNRQQYCSRTCYGNVEGKLALNNIDPKIVEQNRQNIKNYVRRGPDKYSPFRYFMRLFKNKNRSSKWRKGDISLEDLKNIWDNQNGICPFTGLKLFLPYDVTGWKGKKDSRKASIDRIDCSKGYIKTNIRYVSFMANIARNNYSDEELIEFCKAVAMNKSKNEDI